MDSNPLSNSEDTRTSEPTNVVFCTLTFAEGEHRVPVQRICRENYDNFNLLDDGIQVVKQDTSVLQYYSNCCEALPPTRNSPQEHDWIEICDNLVRNGSNSDQNWNGIGKSEVMEKRVGSVIPRDGTSQSPETAFANVVHRDLDETSVSNYEKDGFLSHINCWVPLSNIGDADYPLAFLRSSTHSPTQRRGYMGLAHDTTGLAFGDQQKYFYFENLKPGDVLIWRSEVVYHAAMKGMGCGPDSSSQNTRSHQESIAPTRKSLDMRFHYKFA